MDIFTCSLESPSALEIAKLFSSWINISELPIYVYLIVVFLWKYDKLLEAMCSCSLNVFYFYWTLSNKYQMHSEFYKNGPYLWSWVYSSYTFIHINLLEFEIEIDKFVSWIHCRRGIAYDIYVYVVLFSIIKKSTAFRYAHAICRNW